MNLTRKIIILTLTGGLLVLLAFVFWPAPNRPFAKYVYSPVPRSVRIISFRSNDWLGANPEPVCYLRFTASPDDIATVIRRGDFQPASTNGSVAVPTGGPAGWLPADQIGPSGRVYTRFHRAAGGGLHIGGNRIWSEFLWIDGTGTNVYFLLWGV